VQESVAISYKQVNSRSSVLQKVVCISHSKDVDGLISAAFIRAAEGAEVVLVDYHEFLPTLETLPVPDHLYICDLGLSESTMAEFLKMLTRFCVSAKVTYIDHHPLPVGAKARLQRMGVDLIHSLDECTGVLTYELLKHKLPTDAFLFAAYAAVTDYRDDSDKAKRLIEKFDRQYILMEATALSYAVAKRGDDRAAIYGVMKSLSKFKHPHEIKDVFADAQKHALATISLFRTLGSTGKKLRNLAYTVSKERAGGIVAHLLIGAMDTKVGLALKDEGDGFMEASLRAKSTCTTHLGQLVSSTAAKLGGFGGGHPRAAGARFPKDQLDNFLHLIDAGLESD